MSNFVKAGAIRFLPSYYIKMYHVKDTMRKIAGIGILCMAFGMFLMLLVRDRLVGLLLILVLAAAGYFCLTEC